MTKAFSHLLLSFLIVFSFAQAVSCKQKTKSGKINSTNTDGGSQYGYEYDVYKKAYSVGDHHTAVSAITRMLVLDSTQTHFYDSLTRHYVAIGNARSAAHYAEKALELDPGDEKMLEMAGYIYFEGGSFRKAEEKFNKLYQISKDLKYLYQLSQIYGYMSEIKKSNEMTDMILKDPAADDYKVEVATSDGQVQLVKIKAAAHFVKANLQQSPKAILSQLNRALIIQPDFEIARKIRDEMELQMKMEETQKMEERLNKLRGGK